MADRREAAPVDEVVRDAVQDAVDAHDRNHFDCCFDQSEVEAAIRAAAPHRAAAKDVELAKLRAAHESAQRGLIRMEKQRDELRGGVLYAAGFDPDTANEDTDYVGVLRDLRDLCAKHDERDTIERAHPNQERADEQATGLRALADMIQANPDLIATKDYLFGMHLWHATDGDIMAQLARAGLAHGAKIDKKYSGTSFNLKLSWGPVGAMVLGYRDQVCERVVTGVETVTTTVPDPTALAAVPQVEVTEQVETVRWECRPLLAAEVQQ